MTLYTVQEAADILGISRRHVDRLIRAGQLRASHVTPRTWRIRAEDLEAFVASRIEKGEDQ